MSLVQRPSIGARPGVPTPPATVGMPFAGVTMNAIAPPAATPRDATAVAPAKRPAMPGVVEPQEGPLVFTQGGKTPVPPAMVPIIAEERVIVRPGVGATPIPSNATVKHVPTNGGSASAPGGSRDSAVSREGS